MTPASYDVREGPLAVGHASAHGRRRAFRVFHREHPEIVLKALSTNPDIDGMIERVTAGARAAAESA